MPAINHPVFQEVLSSAPDDPKSAAARVLTRAGPDGPRLVGHLLARGRQDAADELSATFPVGRPYTACVVEALASETLLTGAEAIAVILAASGTTTVFGYAGTSELALCDAVDRTAGIEMINGRGDKESAFMAAGASLLSPGNGAAILHGARGLTNAAGGVVDARRNEAGVVYVVGLPSTSSAPFLPPHGEDGLLPAIGALTEWWWEAPAVPEEPEVVRMAAAAFVARVREAVRRVRQAPHRPALVGIPQDVAERRWLPVTALLDPPVAPVTPAPDPDTVNAAVGLLAMADRPVLLVDDYALRFDGIRAGLDRISRSLGAAVLQVRYRRGAMLFERLRPEEVAGFSGWLNPYSDAHHELLERCDLLMTVEDRNIYPRVVGPLPACRKVAFNTDPAKVVKNRYLAPDDLVVRGDPGESLRRMAELLERGGLRREPWYGAEVAAGSGTTPEPADDHVLQARRTIAEAVAGLLAGWPHPVLVDDSQMFGGLLSEHYDVLPPGVRVFGGHGGFVGSGVPLATGLAVADRTRQVLCTLGDQAFTNSFQGLVAAIQQRPRIVYLVCNNGRSVSLTKQAGASGPEWFDGGRRPLLHNVPAFDYCAVARSFDIPATTVEVPVGAGRPEVSAGVARLSEELARAAASDGPALVELRLPSDSAAWRGIWVTQGFERHRVAA